MPDTRAQYNGARQYDIPRGGRGWWWSTTPTATMPRAMQQRVESRFIKALTTFTLAEEEDFDGLFLLLERLTVDFDLFVDCV